MTIQDNKLILCGCGWLGGYLASHFRSVLPIFGTTRSQEKAQQLAQQNITPILFGLGDNTDELLAVSGDSTFILNIPPGRRNTDLTMFIANMKALLDDLFRHTPPRQLIFISTTAVYGDLQGKITAQSPLQPSTASGEAHVNIEHYVQHIAPETGYILRLAGLVGPDRHPVNTLAGRTLSGATQVVNLVHIDDVVKVIDALMTRQPTRKLWQLCSTEHPMRGEYYPQMAKRLGLPAVSFDDELSDISEPSGKTIDASTTIDELGISLAYPSPWHMSPTL